MERSNYKNKNIDKKYVNTWYDWLINYILEEFWRSSGGFKDKVVTLFKINKPEQIMYASRKKLGKPKTHKHSEKNIIKTLEIFFN